MVVIIGSLYMQLLF